MKKLFEELRILEGFQNLIRGGKVPIGESEFIYSFEDEKDADLCEGSATARGMEFDRDGDYTVLVFGTADKHISLIASLQNLGVTGSVEEGA